MLKCVGAEVHGGAQIARASYSGEWFVLAALVVTAVVASTGIARAQIPLDVLHSFSGRTDPAQPTSLIQATDGNFYGTTTEGGAFGLGTVFRMGADGTVTVLHAFNATDGGAFRGHRGLMQATDGNLYGITGAVFRMSLSGAFQAFPVVANSI